MQDSHIGSLANYEIMRMEPTLILMRNRESRKVYRYCESIDMKQIQKIGCEGIIYPTCIQTGYLYEAGYLTLTTQIQNINRAADKCTFQESQIINTVQPIIKMLKILHERNQAHGGITPDNIIIDDMGNLKIYYPGIPQSIKYYYDSPKIKVQDDYKALALIILQLLGFHANKAEDQIKILRILSKVQKYSQNFIFTLLCMLQNRSKFIVQAIDNLIQSQGVIKLQGEAKQLYEIEILEKNKKLEAMKRAIEKVQFTPPLLKHADHTPRKTMQITKKYVRVQDTQNKKVYEQSKKKKTMDQPLKKVSNGKLQGQSNVNVGSPNYKKILRDIRQTKQREDLFKIAVTVKRMRTVSKKKLG